ncbi:class I lanthipeptide [Spirosoma soli]|uniref:Class I lanthipeptide n=1 Tax=Spirosoma soli TaxID=1770529 RepID=A0ABW5M9K5_9BACT
MKTKTTTKLTLRKKSIAKLDNNALRQIMGGNQVLEGLLPEPPDSCDCHIRTGSGTR